jgi:hypothetical protein
MEAPRLIAVLTIILITLISTPVLAEELQPREYDRSIIEKLKIAIEVNHGYVAGGFDEKGNWVISYAVKRS